MVVVVVGGEYGKGRCAGNWSYAMGTVRQMGGAWVRGLGWGGLCGGMGQVMER